MGLKIKFAHNRRSVYKFQSNSSIRKYNRSLRSFSKMTLKMKQNQMDQQYIV